MIKKGSCHQLPYIHCKNITECKQCISLYIHTFQILCDTFSESDVCLLRHFKYLRWYLVISSVFSDTEKKELTTAATSASLDANLPLEQLLTYCPTASGLWMSDVSHVLSLILKGPSRSLPLQDLKELKAFTLTILVS